MEPDAPRPYDGIGMRQGEGTHQSIDHRHAKGWEGSTHTSAAAPGATSGLAHDSGRDAAFTDESVHEHSKGNRKGADFSPAIVAAHGIGKEDEEENGNRSDSRYSLGDRVPLSMRRRFDDADYGTETNASLLDHKIQTSLGEGRHLCDDLWDGDGRKVWAPTAAPETRSGDSALTEGSVRECQEGDRDGSLPPAIGVAYESEEEIYEDNDEGGFRLGDHVYIWCNLGVVPGVFQHHGIVVDVTEPVGGAKDDGNGDGRNEAQEKIGGTVTIADFSYVVSDEAKKKDLPSSSSLSSSFATSLLGRMRRFTITNNVAETRWRRVKYSARWIRRAFRRSGTCTAVPTDPPGLVLSRVQFLLDNQHLLPPYHILRSNCECVAVWCKTGSWCTLQGSSFLHMATAGQAKGVSTVGLFAAAQTTTVTAPAGGVWGWMGFTTTTSVPLMTTQPYLIPLIAGYGAISVGAPMVLLHMCQKFWKRTTDELNDAFWADAVSKPDIFVECITTWSNSAIRA